jgi:hypothetical protein
MHIPLQAIGVMLLVVGILIPIKAFFKKAVEESEEA